MELSPHPHRPRDPLSLALEGSDRAREAVARSWSDFTADPSFERQFELLRAMAAEVDSLARLEIARRDRARPGSRRRP